MPSRGVVFAVVVALVAPLASACGNKNRQKRAGDAAPVEVVQQPVLGDAGVGGGASGDEIEPNDGEDVATPLSIGATLRGRIDPEVDADFYRLDIKDAGALNVEVTAVDGMDLTVELLDGGGSALARSDRGGVHVREGVPNLGVTPGRYTVVVRAKKLPPTRPVPAPKKRPAKPPKKGAAGAPGAPAAVVIDPAVAAPSAAPVYEITAKVAAPPANAEREPDDDRGTANDLIVGDTVTGFVGWTGDADVWKLSVEALSAKNVVDIELSAVEGVALTLEVADGVGHVLLARKAPKGSSLVVRGLVPVVPPGSAPYHYLIVKGDRSNHETAYQLRVSEKVPGPDAEVEPDDAPDHAMPFSLERKVVHGTWAPGDLDFYALPVEQAARTVEITIDPPADADLSAEVLIDGKVVGKGEHLGKGVQEKFTAAIPAGATALLKVRGTDASIEGTYDVTLQDGPAAP